MAGKNAQFDAAPFARPLEKGFGLIWDDPREIHRVVAHFEGKPPDDLALQYWRSRWPHIRLPKDRVPKGGDAGWWELGDWFKGEWQTADADLSIEGEKATFTFRPINEKEFPELTDFPATYRTTLKIRLISRSGEPLPPLEGIEAYTDSTLDEVTITVLWGEEPPHKPLFSAFNGYVVSAEPRAEGKWIVKLLKTVNPDPNTFDKTLLTVQTGDRKVTILVDDLSSGPIYSPHHGICFVEGEEERDFQGVVSQLLISSGRSIYDCIAELPEQTWGRAWGNMVPKRSRIYLPLGIDGGRHKFRLNPDGSIFYRSSRNLRYHAECPGRDTPLFKLDKPDITLSFDLPPEPSRRGIQEGCLPIGVTEWEVEGVRIEQTAFMTVLEGVKPGITPLPDSIGVLMVRFSFENETGEEKRIEFRMRSSAEGRPERLELDGDRIAADGRLRAVFEWEGKAEEEGGSILFAAELPPNGTRRLVLKIPYLPVDQLDELRRLDFDREREAVAEFWRRRLDEGMRLITPEPMLNEFHRAHAAHLLINCEGHPEGGMRFARVGSFAYGVYGNESCMMILDLDRRGYHREARECLEAFLRYQGTVGLPGDFSSKEGVLYGACGYECGGYNQHHGWILWCLVEHYRFTRDEEWLRRIAPNIVAAADWIIRERSRTLGRDDIGRGLLPHGSLEDIGDWWQWLATNAYTWRGLDAAAWALERIGHPDAPRIRREADDYKKEIIRAFKEASERSPLIKLRDGTYVPHFPSHVHRRGRCFGWICETLEGAIHLLITRLIDPRSEEALWILKDYEDNLYLSGHYGYEVEDFERQWFDLGGFSMQACLLLGAEPYLFRDDVKHALRAIFNAIAANYFPDVRMLTEHALPSLGDWRGDHYKSSDEANAAGWLRYIFVREEGEELILGQAVPREWLRPGNRVGVENAHTHFGVMSLIYEAGEGEIVAKLEAPRRNPPERIRLRFRAPKPIEAIYLNGRRWTEVEGDWALLPGDVGDVEVKAITSTP